MYKFEGGQHIQGGEIPLFTISIKTDQFNNETHYLELLEEPLVIGKPSSSLVECNSLIYVTKPLKLLKGNHQHFLCVSFQMHLLILHQLLVQILYFSNKHEHSRNISALLSNF